MRRFTYAAFTEEAREIVVTAAGVALSNGTEKVLPTHLRAALDGAHSGAECARIPFDASLRRVLTGAHELAASSGEMVEIRHLRSAVEETGTQLP